MVIVREISTFVDGGVTLVDGKWMRPAERATDSPISLHRRGIFMLVRGFSNFARVRAAAFVLAASTACWTIPAQAQSSAAAAAATPAVPAHATLGDWGV